MKIKDLRKKSTKDLEKEATKLRDAIAKAEVDKYTTEEKNRKLQRNQRKYLARVLTVLNDADAEVTEEKKEEAT